MKMDKIEYLEHKDFSKELRKMEKKCPSIYEDFKTFKKAIEVDLENNNNLIPLNTNKYSKIKPLKTKYTAVVCKRFRCMKSNAGAGQTPFRLTFVFSPDDFLIYFAEFYYKEHKKTENLGRIKEVIAKIDELG